VSSGTPAVNVLGMKKVAKNCARSVTDHGDQSQEDVTRKNTT